MSLQITGRCLEATDEPVEYQGRSWISRKRRILTGKASIEEVTLAEDFPRADNFGEGDDVVLEVVVGTFARKGGGAGYRLTALGRLVGSEIKTPAAAGAK